MRIEPVFKLRKNLIRFAYYMNAGDRKRANEFFWQCGKSSLFNMKLA